MRRLETGESVTPEGRPAVLVVIGTRPEAIKLAPVIWALRASSRLTPVVCLTAQHRELVDRLLPLLGLEPDHDLGLMTPDQRPSCLAGSILHHLPPILDRVAPAIALVQGDTTSAMAAAIACHYTRIPIGHVEAGLRTGDLSQPFPEEANRRIISAVATFHFAPTARARSALLAESVPADRIFLSGNTVVDALHRLAARTPQRENGERAARRDQRRTILVTAHRRENLGRPLAELCRALRTLARIHPDIRILYPVHPNPHVSGPVRAALGREPGIELTPPLEYPEFIRELQRCYLVLTDSGGVQEEAPVFGKPVLVLREQSERVEAVEMGSALLVGCAHDTIVAAAGRLLHDPQAYRRMSHTISPFGDGHAAERIVRVLERWGLSVESERIHSVVGVAAQ